MKTSSHILATALAAAALFSTQALHAESTYGYSTDGSAVSATARVDVTVTIPKLVLLRVGSGSTTVDAVNLALTPVIPGATTATLGSSQAMDTGWDGQTLPSFTAPTVGTSVVAAAWTNNATGASLSGVATTPAGLSATAITVTATAGTNGNLLDHPGATTGSASVVNLGANTLYTANWAYNVDPAAIATSTAGAYTQNVTYTATTL